MFILALIYLFILLISIVGFTWNDPRAVRVGGFAQWVLFLIIGIVLFYSVLNKG